MQTSIEAVLGLDGVCEMEKYYMNDDMLDNFNASVAYAWPNAIEETQKKLLRCQESLNSFNSAADNINYEIIDKLKTLTDEGINADDDCLYALKRLNETNLLHLVPCAVAGKAKAITDNFRAAAFAQYSATKNALVPNIIELTQELEALTAALMVNPNELGSRIEAFAVALNVAQRSIENGTSAIPQFVEITTNLTNQAEGDFKNLSIEIKNLAPELAAEIASEAPVRDAGLKSAAEAETDLADDIAEEAELAAEAAREAASREALPEVTPAVASTVTPAIAPEVVAEVTPTAAPVTA